MGALEEAQKRLKAGEKAASKGFFKKPDWDVASVEFSKAAQMFRSQKQFEEAKKAYLRAADCDKNNMADYAVGKATEDAANMCTEMKKKDEALVLMEEAAQFYQRASTPDKAGQTLTKAAKLSENPEKAADLFLSAIEIFEENDKMSYATDALKAGAQLCIKNGLHERAHEVYSAHIRWFEDAERNAQAQALRCSIVLLWLLEDDVKGEKYFTEFAEADNGFIMSREGALAQKFVTAFQNRDPEMLEEAKKDRIVLNFLDSELLRQIKGMTIAAGTGVVDGVDPEDEDDIL
eukprot:TRINITY_DN5732_c0_g1_i1.p1 TRINITY_DN5732_c0_g1~~TRINITY_DN5732_c0_g1_i1.p1  ORF type:complete len:291 (-),score=95.31 TRINITY_DN5732_c0_g1_i1:66-938(-)